MRKEGKSVLIEELKDKFDQNPNFYIADSSALTVAQINNFRRICFEKGIEVLVVKNTLAQKALESFDESKNFAELYGALKGPTTLLFSSTANLPAKVIKQFRKTAEKPLIKAAYIDTSIFIGDDKLEALVTLKSKEELVGEIIGLLQSPAKNVISALKSGGGTLAGLVKTLQDRAN